MASAREANKCVLVVLAFLVSCVPDSTLLALWVWGIRFVKWLASYIQSRWSERCMSPAVAALPTWTKDFHRERSTTRDGLEGHLEWSLSTKWRWTNSPGAHFHHLCLEVFHESPCYVCRAPQGSPPGAGAVRTLRRSGSVGAYATIWFISSRVTDVITIKCSRCQQIAFGLNKPWSREKAHFPNIPFVLFTNNFRDIRPLGGKASASKLSSLNAFFRVKSWAQDSQRR